MTAATVAMPPALRVPQLRGWIWALALLLVADAAVFWGVFGGRLPAQYQYEITPENEELLRALLQEVAEAWPSERILMKAMVAIKFDIGVQAIPTLMEYTRHEDSTLRRVALGALGALEDQTATPAVLEAMQDPEPLVVFSATMTLGDLGDPRSRDALVAALDHPDYRVRAGAALNLGLVGPRMRDVETLIAHIEDPHNLVGQTIQEVLADVCVVNPTFLGRSRALWEQWWQTTGQQTVDLPTA